LKPGLPGFFFCAALFRFDSSYRTAMAPNYRVHPYFWLPADFALMLPALWINIGPFSERAKKYPGIRATPGLYMRTE
jgi:hypothetical protein